MLLTPPPKGGVLSAAARHWPSSPPEGKWPLRAGWRPPEVWKSPPAPCPQTTLRAGVAAAFIALSRRPGPGGFLEEVALSFLLRGGGSSPFPGLFLTLFPFPGLAWGQEPPRTTPGPAWGPLWVFRLIFHSCRPILLTAPPDHVGWEGSGLDPCMSGLSFLAHEVWCGWL